jgi:flagellar protein FliS
MPSSTMLRSRYVTDSVETMSPARLVVALYDRLVLDLRRAETAIGNDDVVAAHDAFVHAQEIVCELSGTLDVSVWPAAAQLASLYDYVLGQLVQANVHKDAGLAAECRSIVEPLRDAWREAAGVVGGSAPLDAA